jgi:hypothetical protein
MRQAFNLPDFRYDCEIDSRWGLSEREGVAVNVTQLTLGRRGHLEELPGGFPDYNFLLILSVSSHLAGWEDGHWLLDSTIVDLSRRLASLIGVEVNYLASRGTVKSPRFLCFRP